MNDNIIGNWRATELLAVLWNPEMAQRFPNMLTTRSAVNRCAQTRTAGQNHSIRRAASGGTATGAGSPQMPKVATTAPTG